MLAMGAAESSKIDNTKGNLADDAPRLHWHWSEYLDALCRKI